MIDFRKVDRLARYIAEGKTVTFTPEGSCYDRSDFYIAVQLKAARLKNEVVDPKKLDWYALGDKTGDC